VGGPARALTAAFLAFLRRNDWLLAAAAAFAAALTYPIGVMTLPLVGGAYALASRRRGVAALLAAAPLAAFGLIVVAQRWQTGRWTAFFDVQAHYGHGIHNPLGVTWNALLLVTGAAGFHYEPYPVGAWQSLLVAAVLVAVLANLAWHRSRTQLLLAGWALAAWALPLTQANVSVWRSEAALVPVAPLVARLPAPLAWAIVAVAAVLGIALAILYFRGALI
jgi:hypothetical protein